MNYDINEKKGLHWGGAYTVPFCGGDFMKYRNRANEDRNGRNSNRVVMGIVASYIGYRGMAGTRRWALNIAQIEERCAAGARDTLSSDQALYNLIRLGGRAIFCSFLGRSQPSLISPQHP
jgi:hypothetical protein